MLSLVALASCTRAPAQQREVMNAETVYQRYARLEHDPAFEKAITDGAQHLSELAWMVGEWDVTVTAFPTPTTPEQKASFHTRFIQSRNGQIASDDLTTILVYDPFKARWMTAGSEPPLAPINVQTAMAAWDGRTLAFEGENRILGETFVMRQTMTKTDANTFEILNEQNTGNGYARVDLYHFERTPAPPQ